MSYRLVIDARESGTSTGRYIDKLVEYLHKLEPAFDTVVLSKPDRINYLKSVAPDFKIVASPYKEFTFAEQLGFARQLYKLRADLVHFNAPQQPLLYFGRSVTTVHDLTTARFNNPVKNWAIYKTKQLVYKAVVFLVARKAKKIIAISKYVKNDLASFAKINTSKISVIYEAADKITEPPEKMPRLNSLNFLMYVGRPAPHKNLKRLVEALEILIQTRPDLKLVLAGKNDANYQKIQKFVEKKSLTSQVIFTGFVSEGQLRWLYENCRAYVFPSLSEGFGLPALEAMAHGAPVVSSSATCLPEIYGSAALYFDPLEVSDIAAKIGQVLDSPNLRNQLVASGQAQVAKYSWDKTAGQTLEIYKNILR